MIIQIFKAWFKRYLPEGVEHFLSDNFDPEKFKRTGEIFFVAGQYELTFFDNLDDAKEVFDRGVEDTVESWISEGFYAAWTHDLLSQEDYPDAGDMPAIFRVAFTDDNKAHFEIVDALTLDGLLELLREADELEKSHVDW